MVRLWGLEQNFASRARFLILEIFKPSPNLRTVQLFRINFLGGILTVGGTGAVPKSQSLVGPTDKSHWHNTYRARYATAFIANTPKCI